MGMTRKIFRPGVGQTPARFTSAFLNGATCYAGDLVCWDITAPTSQAFNGATDTLGATDYIYVIHPPAAAAAANGLQAGILQGDGINRDSAVGTANLLTNDQLVIVQTWGVAPDVFAVTSTDSAAGIMLVTGATTGAVTQVLATDAIAATDQTLFGGLVGFALNAQATDHSRGATATEPGLDMFVRCDF